MHIPFFGSFHLKKYLYFAKIILLLGASSPVRFFGWLFADVLLLGAFYLLFEQLFKQKPIVEGYTFTTFFTYYAITTVIKKFTTSLSVANMLRSFVKFGDLSAILLKPVNPVAYLSTSFFVRRIVEYSLPIIFVIVIAIVSPNIINRPVHPIYFMCSLFLGIILGQLFYAILGTLAFWVTETWGYMSVINRTVGLLAGNIVPLDLLPSAFVTVGMYLPFKYMHYVPLMIYLGRYNSSEIFQQIGIQLITILILYVLYKFFWSIGIKKYGAVGN